MLEEEKFNADKSVDSQPLEIGLLKFQEKMVKTKIRDQTTTN
jgi:hypothetical protein